MSELLVGSSPNNPKSFALYGHGVGVLTRGVMQFALEREFSERSIGTFGVPLAEALGDCIVPLPLSEQDARMQKAYTELQEADLPIHVLGQSQGTWAVPEHASSNGSVTLITPPVSSPRPRFERQFEAALEKKLPSELVQEGVIGVMPGLCDNGRIVITNAYMKELESRDPKAQLGQLCRRDRTVVILANRDHLYPEQRPFFDGLPDRRSLITRLRDEDHYFPTIQARNAAARIAVYWATFWPPEQRSQ